jgi:hypothetical protein
MFSGSSTITGRLLVRRPIVKTMAPLPLCRGAGRNAIASNDISGASACFATITTADVPRSARIFAETLKALPSGLTSCHLNAPLDG